MSLHQLTQALKASLEAQAAATPVVEPAVENLTPDGIEPNPKDKAPATEPNQVPEAGATVDQSDSKTVVAPKGPEVEPNPEDKEPCACSRCHCHRSGRSTDTGRLDRGGRGFAGILRLSPTNLGMGRSLDQKIEFKKKQLAGAVDELKRMEGEFEKEGQSRDNKYLDEHRSDVERFKQQLAELEAKKLKSATESVDTASIESLDDETDHLEAAQEAFQGLNAICTDTEDLAAVTEGLVNVLEMIHAAGDPLTTRDVPFINLAVEGLVGQFGMTDMISPSLESVDNDPTKYVVSLEGRINTAIKQALEWIKELLKNARDFIVAFFEKIFDRAEWLNRKAVKIKAKADSLSGAKAEATTVAVSSGGEYLLVGGHVDPIKSVDAYLTAVAAVMAADDDYAELFAKSIQAIEALSEKNVPAEELFEKLKDVQASEKAAMSRPNAFFAHKSDEGYKSELFPGGIYFSATVNDAGVVSYAKHGSDKVTLNETCAVLPVADIHELAVKVEHLAKGLIDLRKHYSKTNQSQLQSALSKLAANIAHLPEVHQHKLVAQVRAFGENQTKAWRQSAMVVTMMTKGANAALVCAEKMLAEYKDEAKG